MQLVSLSFVSYLSYGVHPLKILKIKSLLFLFFILTVPFWLLHAQSATQIFLIQAISVSLAIDTAPAVPVFLSHLPVLKRYTYASFTYAISRAGMYIVTSFGLIYLTTWIGPWGLWFVFLPSILGFFAGLQHFEKLEFASGQPVPEVIAKTAA